MHCSNILYVNPSDLWKAQLRDSHNLCAELFKIILHSACLNCLGLVYTVSLHTVVVETKTFVISVFFFFSYLTLWGLRVFWGPGEVLTCSDICVFFSILKYFWKWYIYIFFIIIIIIIFLLRVKNCILFC